MAENRRGPIGIELVRRGLISQEDINKALDYQKKNPGKKIVEIIRTLNLCDEYILLEALGEILNEKTVMLSRFRYSNKYIKIHIIRYGKKI